MNHEYSNSEIFDYNCLPEAQNEVVFERQVKSDIVITSQRKEQIDIQPKRSTFRQIQSTLLDIQFPIAYKVFKKLLKQSSLMFRSICQLKMLKIPNFQQNVREIINGSEVKENDKDAKRQELKQELALKGQTNQKKPASYQKMLTLVVGTVVGSYGGPTMMNATTNLLERNISSFKNIFGRKQKQQQLESEQSKNQSIIVQESFQAALDEEQKSNDYKSFADIEEKPEIVL